MIGTDKSPGDPDQFFQFVPPEQNDSLSGHATAYNQIFDACKTGKLHHAWMISGAKGVGKATFAFAVARKLLALSGNEDIERVSTLVANGTHPNLKIIRRSINQKTGIYSASINVDQIRQAVRFFQTSAARAGLRLCIVDSMDDLNVNAANALLKTLEEPPTNTLFLLINHRFSLTLPTLRSRCRSLRLTALSNDEVLQVIEKQSPLPPGEDIDRILQIAGGRPRRALEAVRMKENQLLDALSKMLVSPARISEQELMDAAEQIATSKEVGLWEVAIDMLTTSIVRITKQQLMAGSRSRAVANALDVWEKTNDLLADQAIFNLEKKQTVVAILDAIRDIDRASSTGNR